MKIDDGCSFGIKTFQVIDPAVSEYFPSQVVGKIHKIELRLPNGTNYLHAQDFVGDHPGLGDAGMMIHRMKEKGEINLEFWKEGDPVYGSERYMQREPEIVAYEIQRDEDEEEYSQGPR